MNRIIKKTDIAKFFESMSKDYEIIAPVKRGKIVKFDKIEDFNEIVFDRQSDFSPRNWLIPQKETLFTYKNNKLIETIEKTKRIFIVRPCDANAIEILDKIFLNEKEDPYYAARRKNMLLFVFVCKEPFENCFCTSVNSFDTTNFDLKFIDLGDKYLVNVGTRAAQIVKNKAFHQVFREGKSKLECSKWIINPNTLDYKSGEKTWEKFAKKCVFCDSCTAVCPTSFCFKVKDEINLDLKSGKRVREITRCYEKNQKDKIKNNIFCKMKYSKERFGKKSCVGCGRCIMVCPKNLDMVTILNEIE